jgi:hypothetical protein
MVSFLWTFPSKPFTLSLLSHTRCMAHLSLYPSFNLPNDIWGWVQIMKLPTVQLSSFSRYIISLRSKHYSQPPVLKHPQSVYFPSPDRQSFTLIQYNWWNYGSVYFNLYIPRQQVGKQKTLNWKVAGILEFSLLLISLCAQIGPEYLKFATPSKDMFIIFLLCFCRTFR